MTCSERLEALLQRVVSAHRAVSPLGEQIGADTMYARGVRDGLIVARKFIIEAQTTEALGAED